MSQIGDTTKIELNREDAELLTIVMKYRKQFKFMIIAGIFDIHRGNATINFKDNGDIQSIEKKEFLYEKDIEKKGLTKIS